MSERVKTNNDIKKQNPTPKGSTGTQTSSFAIKCAFCAGQHYSASCESITKLGERKDILRKSGRCFVCLQFGHRGNQCSKNCRQCGGKHHQSIIINRSPDPRDPCLEQESKQAENTSAKTATSTEDHVIVANQTVAVAGSSRGNERKIFLQTATTQACAQGNQVPVRVLMDSGSQRTYVTLKNKLGLAPEKTELLNLNTFGNDKVERRKCDKVKLQLKGQSKDIEISALSFPKICAPLSTTLDIDEYPHLQGLQLADDNLLSNDTDSDVDILIGSDYYYDIITGEIQRGGVGPCAVNSEFGWLTCGSGKAKIPGRDETVANFVAERNDVLPHNLIFVKMSTRI